MTDATTSRTVVLRGIRGSAHLANVDHIRDLVQELKLVQIGQRTGATPVGVELARLMEGILDVYNGPTDDSYRQARRLVEDGGERIDLELQLPATAVADAQRLLELLERADALCERERLLALAAPDQIRRLRRWTTEEIAHQFAGGQPRTCPV